MTATYPGDTNYKGTTATGASFTVTKADPVFSESAAPASVPYGTADTRVGHRPARRRHRDGDLHVRWINALHHHACR